jgi:hypothetical protein
MKSFRKRSPFLTVARKHWPLAAIGGGGPLVILTMGILTGREEPVSSGPSGLVPVPAEPSRSAPALDAARVIRSYYEAARGVSAADWTSAGCQDESIGFKNLADCEASAAERMLKIGESLPVPAAKFDCGQEIERKSLAFIRAQVADHNAFLTWLTSSRAKLSRAMSGRTLQQACRQHPAVCEQRPISLTSLDVLNSVECTTDLFVCLPGRGNVCWINKVADRLRDRSNGTLLVRATGEPVPAF